jgi:hypothetical protein
MWSQMFLLKLMITPEDALHIANRKLAEANMKHTVSLGFVDGYFLCEFYTLHLTRNSCSES